MMNVQAWTARLSFVLATAAAVGLLLTAGLRSFTLLGIGVGGLMFGAAAAWWVLTHHGMVRYLAALLAILVPVAVLVRYAVVGMLWTVIAFVALWTLATLAGRAALRADSPTPGPTEYVTPPPAHPFLIMNPRSGGGKVGTFHLDDKARDLGAEVVVLDPDHPQDVAELARDAASRGADLLGVAGGDGTQALVAGVAAEKNLPFMVISAGTRNHFALDLGLDREDPSTGLTALTGDGIEIRVDLGLIGDRVFVNNASFGAYAAIVQSPHYRDDKVGTTLQMLPDLLTHHGGPRLTVRAKDLLLDAPQAVLVSNNPYQGGDPAGLGRRERLDSGVLGVLGVTVANAAQAAGIIRGRRSQGLTAVTVTEVVIDADTPEIPVGVDGEALMLPTPVHCHIEPAALRVRVPRNRRQAPKSKPQMNWRRLTTLAFTRQKPTPLNA
ncbi:NAD(+)/NADH kinase [Actinomadura barringtoniae]|uniref:NAD(+)/NADH kinase n=1 Tax=Actinomadura barringtoniae TaxID=1427535 RepID=A0A939P601_9ACTN|nr:diacylglycerol kinase family protein [Actinomadura barringtoniae]MBO2446007.1 NAD(+)/NADH kinase [Actinomadura barringtoniae]